MKRIAAIEAQPGVMAAVWLAWNPETDVLHLYDCFRFQHGEVLAVVASAMNARGRNIPVAWRNGDLADELRRKHGCRMMPVAVTDTDEMADMLSRDIHERMRTGRFKVDKRLKEWLDEMQAFQRKDKKIPRDEFPLMAATRHAIGMLKYARGESAGKSINYPRLAFH